MQRIVVYLVLVCSFIGSGRLTCLDVGDGFKTLWEVDEDPYRPRWARTGLELHQDDRIRLVEGQSLFINLTPGTCTLWKWEKVPR